MHLDELKRNKQMVLRLRWLTILITSYLILFGKSFNFPQLLPSLFIFFYLLSNLIAYFIPACYFKRNFFFYILLLFDTLMVSLGIYITSQFETDFYLVYFLIIIFASVGRSFKLTIINAFVICGIYGWFIWDKGLSPGAMEEGVLLRIPFIFIMNVFYGFLAHSFNEKTKRIEKELEEVEESEQRYRQIVERTHDSVVIVNKNFQIKFFNQRLLQLTQYRAEELNNAELTKIMNGFVGEGSIKNLLRNLDSGEPVTHEADVFQKDGGMRKVEVSAAQFGLPNGEMNTIIYLKDITEKKQMEERLIESEKLTALGELAGGVAHDFNNALAVILGNTQLLLMDGKDEDFKETLKTIEKTTQDASHTVKRLQDFAKKRPPEEPLQVDINRIIKEAVDITKPKWKDEAQGKGISNEIALNLKKVPAVDGVPSELREVIINMVFNAVEAMPEGGTIEIQTFEKRGKLHIRIRDTGIGMPDEVRKKVLEPFFTTKPFSNTGLGLSVSYGIIKRWGGEIEVESQVGKGTSFTISLPQGTKGKEPVIADSVIKEGKKGRILVIDDEEQVRNVLLKMLCQAHHQVTVAGAGAEGVRLFKESRFDVVLTDLGMPGMSGWEVCKAIKGISPECPVGMITGWGAEVDGTRMEENGVDFVISKPFDCSQILNVVTDVMEFRG